MTLFVYGCEESNELSFYTATNYRENDIVLIESKDSIIIYDDFNQIIVYKGSHEILENFEKVDNGLHGDINGLHLNFVSDSLSQEGILKKKNEIENLISIKKFIKRKWIMHENTFDKGVFLKANDFYFDDKYLNVKTDTLNAFEYAVFCPNEIQISNSDYVENYFFTDKKDTLDLNKVKKYILSEIKKEQLMIYNLKPTITEIK